jgi:hypothetical protein
MKTKRTGAGDRMKIGALVFGCIEIIQVVNNSNLMAFSYQLLGKMRADEARAACDKNFHIESLILTPQIRNGATDVRKR